MTSANENLATEQDEADTGVDLFDAVALDEAGEEAGILTPLPGLGSTQFRIARANNKAYNKLIRRLYKANKRLLDAGGPEADKVAINMDIELMAKTILLGWEGSPKIKGVATPYSEAAARTLLAHKEFRRKVTEFSQNADNYLLKKEDEDEKN